MLRRGRREGWLSITEDVFQAWAALNQVDFGLVSPGNLPQRGGALLARRTITQNKDEARLVQLLSVPNDLILGLDRVVEHTKFDSSFREVLESLGDFVIVGPPVLPRPPNEIII